MTPRQPTLKTRTAYEHQLRRRIATCYDKRDEALKNFNDTEAERQRRLAAVHRDTLKRLGARE